MHHVDVAANYDVNENITIYGDINNVFSKDRPILGSAAISLPATYDALGRATFNSITAKTS